MQLTIVIIIRLIGQRSQVLLNVILDKERIGKETYDLNDRSA
jgi:hypothetical protein